MVMAPQARKRPGRRVGRALAIQAKRRRDERRGFPAMQQTHRVPIGGTAIAAAAFADPLQPVTFKARVSRTSGTAAGDLITLGGEGSLAFLAGDLILTMGAETFAGVFVGAPRSSAEVVLSILPGKGQVRVWVDSDLAIAGTLASFPVAWISTGSVAYSAPTGVELLSDLDVFDCQFVRHFCQVNTGEAGTPIEEDESILCRAATATHLATSAFPFTDCPVP